MCLAANTSVAVQLLKLNVDVLAVAPSHMSVADAITNLLIPAICDQLVAMSKMVKKNASQSPKVHTAHDGFCCHFKCAFQYGLEVVSAEDVLDSRSCIERCSRSAVGTGNIKNLECNVFICRFQHFISVS